MRGRRRPLTGERLRLGASVDGKDNTRDSKSNRTQRRQLKSLRRRGLQLLVLAAMGIVLWHLGSPIKTVTFEGANQEQARQSFEAHYSSGLSRLNILINTDDLAQKMTNDVPNAVTTTVEHNPLLSRLKIKVITQQPAIRWQTRGIQYTVSDHGVVLGLSSEGDSHLPIIFDEANIGVDLKEQILPKSFTDFVKTLDLTAISKGLKIRERFVRGSIRELRVVTEGTNYSVLLDTQRGVGEQLDELLRLQKYFDANGVRASEYIDLRIPGRAYWK